MAEVIGETDAGRVFHAFAVHVVTKNGLYALVMCGVGNKNMKRFSKSCGRSSSGRGIEMRGSVVQLLTAVSEMYAIEIAKHATL